MLVKLNLMEVTMAYREDSDLVFLRDCSSEDLDVLVQIITKNKNGNDRFTEELTTSERFKQHNPDHRQYWDLIAAEIQCFGANTFATMLRGGEGILYKEVLTDACDKMKVNYNYDAPVEVIEMNLLMKILTDSMEKMTPEELETLVKELDLKTTNFTKQAVITAVQAGIRLSGFAAYKMAVIVANAIAKAIIGRGLSLAVNAGLTRSMAILAGPIGWVITALWTALDIVGPAYRITIPCVVQVAFLRAKLKYK
jgi:uncharacterized protein YaaW (UPF0174 family)